MTTSVTSLARNYSYIIISLFIFSCSNDIPGNQDSRPNIVLIMADDLGFSDLGCYGGEINTPHLDRLADQGLRFSQFYNGTRCCPSRASLLTGLYAQQAGIGHMTADFGFDGYRGELSNQAVTLAEVLKTAGYTTMMTGKWHVTANTSDTSDVSSWPLQRGFDKFYGTLPGHGSFWDPAGLYYGNTPIKAAGDFYYTEVLADSAISFMEKATNIHDPFFLYLSFTAPHYPIHAREKFIKKYEGKYNEGWDELRKKRLDKLTHEGILNEKLEISARDVQSVSWEMEPLKDWQAHRMSVYAAMVEQMDLSIGRVVTAIKESNQLENTMIIFLSDNGGSAEGHLNGMIERWGTPWKSKQIPEYAPNGQAVKAGDFPGEKLGGPETYGSYGLKWANLSNTPFSRFKSWVHEGGISTPFIVHWPNKIKDPGEIRNQQGHLIDIMATLVEVSGAEYPKEFHGNAIISQAGISLVPAILKDSIMERSLFWEHEGNRAMRKGNWKLVSEYPGTWKDVRPYPNSGSWELYNLKNDRIESNDLAQEHPERVRELAAEWKAWADGNMVVDWEEFADNEY